MTMLLDTSTEYEDWVDGEFMNADELEARNILTFIGEPQRHKFPPTTLNILSQPQPPDIFRIGLDLLMSSPLVAKIKSTGANIQYLPVDVRHKGTMMPSESYYIANILDLVECIDRDNSKLKVEKDGIIRSIDELRLNEDRCREYTLCRAARCLPYVICISDALTQDLLAGNWRGLFIYPPEKWRVSDYRGLGKD